VRATAEGLAVDWIARSRRNGDVWDRDVGDDPLHFRVRVLDGGVPIRSWEVDGTGTVYGTGVMATDFPDGPGPDARIGVAQAGPVFGWGVEAVASGLA
jgi:hypothetical protein